MTKPTKDEIDLEAMKAEIERLQLALEEAQQAKEEPGLHSPFTREDVEEFGEKLSEGAQELHRQIDSNPVPSAVIAFVLGFLIARIVSR
ncbi:MAG: hypothetical protein GC184_03710 [Rhizobiales bacterium]|nr:hypothetical protein [Hyphomicrobiales bacterium]